MPKMRVRGKPQHRDVLSIALKATGNHAGRSWAVAPVNLGGPGRPSRQPGCPRRLPRQPGRLPRQAGVPGQPSPPSRRSGAAVLTKPGGYPVNPGGPGRSPRQLGGPERPSRQQNFGALAKNSEHLATKKSLPNGRQVLRSLQSAPKFTPRSEVPGHTTRATAVCCSPKYTQRTQVPGHKAALKPQIRDCP